MYFLYEETEEALFTENETNFQRLYGSKNPSIYVKDAFHDYIISGRALACNRNPSGTKMAPVYRVRLGPAQSRTIYLRLVSVADWDGNPGADPGIFDSRQSETDSFYSQLTGVLDKESAIIFRQAAAGLLWSKQFYHYIVKDWLKGDAFEVPPPASRWLGRNHDWLQVYSSRCHLNAAQVGISVVRSVGSGVSHAPFRTSRSKLRQAAIGTLPS